MGRLHEQESGDLGGEPLRVAVHVRAAERMTDQNVWWLRPDELQKVMKFVGHLLGAAWQVRIVAPSGAGAVVNEA